MTIRGGSERRCSGVDDGATYGTPVFALTMAWRADLRQRYVLTLSGKSGGGRGIRTLGTPKGTTVFEIDGRCVGVCCSVLNSPETGRISEAQMPFSPSSLVWWRYVRLQYGSQKWRVRSVMGDTRNHDPRQLRQIFAPLRGLLRVRKRKSKAIHMSVAVSATAIREIP